jgi:hypothetical protein
MLACCVISGVSKVLSGSAQKGRKLFNKRK